MKAVGEATCDPSILWGFAQVGVLVQLAFLIRYPGWGALRLLLFFSLFSELK